jgi:ABC-type lipoprotein release transport system permease subunit
MGSMGSLLAVAWRSVRRNRRRTAISVTAIAFALAVAIFFVAFAEGAYAQMIETAARMGAGHVTVEHREYRDAPAVDLGVAGVRALRQRLQAVDGVERTKLLVLGQGVARSGDGSSGVAVAGVEPRAEREASSVIARRIVRGAYLADDDLGAGRAVIGQALARRLKLDAGSKLVLVGNDAGGAVVEELVRVQGIFATGADEMDGYLVQVPLGFAQRLYRLGGDQVTQLGLVLSDPGRQGAVLAQVRTLIDPRVSAALPWEGVLPELAAYIRLDGGSNQVMMGILIVLSLFTIFNTLLMSVLERTREFATLLALGTPPRRLRGQLVLEAALLGLMGCALGVALGGLAAYGLQLHGLDMSKLYPDGVSVSGLALDSRMYARVTPRLLAGLGGLVFGAILLTSWFSGRRIAAIPVAEVLR